MASSIKVQWLDLHNTLKAALKLVSKNDCRLALNSVRLEAKDDVLSVVSTNGYALFVASMGCNGTLPSVLVSRIDAMRFLSLKPSAKCEDFCRVATCARKVSFAADGSLMTFRPVDAQYPPYEAVIEKRPVKEPTPAISFDARYIRDICDAFRIMGVAAMKVQHGENESASSLFTASVLSSVDFKIILMPILF